MAVGRSEPPSSSARVDMCRSELYSPLAVAPALPLADMPSNQLTKPMKPRLPRKLTTSARINLNRYWHALEELMPMSRRAFDEADCNAINENIDNERRLAAMQLGDVSCKTSFPPTPPTEQLLDVPGRTSLSVCSSTGDNSTNILSQKPFDSSFKLSKTVEDHPLKTSTSSNIDNPSAFAKIPSLPKEGLAIPMVLDENTPPSQNNDDLI